MDECWSVISRRRGEQMTRLDYEPIVDPVAAILGALGLLFLASWLERWQRRHESRRH